MAERTANRRFPVRIRLLRQGKTVLAVRAQSPWPGPGQQIFCIRERAEDPDEPLESIEEVPVIGLSRVGRKLSVVLDRPVRKRCEFLTVQKARSDGSGTYEQIFLRTESGIRSHRSRTRLELREAPATLTLAIDSAERYAWRFPGATTVRRKLPAGDYALVVQDEAVAVVERKSFDNLLADLGAIQALHHHFADLARFPHPAVVVEAQYGDFLSETRLAGRWPAHFVARALAELTALHPSVPIVFAGNRKEANLWTERFFAACAMARAVPTSQLDLVLDESGAPPPPGGARSTDDRIRLAALQELPPEFTTTEVMRHVGDVTLARVRRVLQGLSAEGRLERRGQRRGLRWIRSSTARSSPSDRPNSPAPSLDRQTLNGYFSGKAPVQSPPPS